MGIFSILTLILPLLFQTIRAVEEAIPGEGEGEKKLAAVGDVIRTVADVIGVAGDDKIQLINAIPSVVSGIVSALNKAGVFKASSGIPTESQY